MPPIPDMIGGALGVAYHSSRNGSYGMTRRRGGACFVVNATAWLDADQQAQIMKDTGCALGPHLRRLFHAIADPEGRAMGEPLTAGEGEIIADLDFAQIYSVSV